MGYDENGIYGRIARCLAEIGISVETDIQTRFIDEDISDSLTYISFIVGIEEEFGITVPDEYLQANVLETYSDVADMIRQISEGEELIFS